MYSVIVEVVINYKLNLGPRLFWLMFSFRAHVYRENIYLKSIRYVMQLGPSALNYFTHYYSKFVFSWFRCRRVSGLENTPLSLPVDVAKTD